MILCREFTSHSSSSFWMSRHGISKRAICVRVEEERVVKPPLSTKRRREMTFDPRTRRTGNVLIASCLFCFASGVYYYAATGGRGGVGIMRNDASRLDDDVQRAVDERTTERKKRDAEDTTKRRRQQKRREQQGDEAKSRRRFWQKKQSRE